MINWILILLGIRVDADTVISIYLKSFILILCYDTYKQFQEMGNELFVNHHKRELS